MAYCSESFSIRLFLDYDVHESLPWHITISRTRQLYGEAIFLDLFKLVLKMCVGKGMVRSKRQALDSVRSPATSQSTAPFQERFIFMEVFG